MRGAATQPRKHEHETTGNRYVRWFETLGSGDVAVVGGKNASLGEMIRNLKDEGIRVPDGFATTAEAYRRFVAANHLEDEVRQRIENWRSGKSPLEKIGREIRSLFRNTDFPEEVAEDIRRAYRELSERYGRKDVDIAARSSATAEDLPEASFAGQQETYLNVHGENDVLEACRKCFASLFTNRAISYRENNGFDHLDVALSVAVQKMVRSDKAGAGVMFSIDTETGFPRTVLINANWGLGESVVQGIVNPDEYMTFKPFLANEALKPVIEKTLGAKEKKVVYPHNGNQATVTVDTGKDERSRFVLSDDEILQLSRWAVIIENHYGKPMDMEWAKDGDTGELYIVQARPETVQSQKAVDSLKTYSLKETGKRLLTGQSIGDAIATGTIKIITSTDEMDRFEEGDVLVTEMTEPDWVPIMKKASAIVTDTGGRTSHAAIVSREYGIPAVVGTGNGSKSLEEGKDVTISCAEGSEGYVYEGRLEYESRDVNLDQLPMIDTRLMMIVASPSTAFRWWRLPTRGVGLARIEFVINNVIKIHPMALIHPERVEDRRTRRQIEQLTAGYEPATEYFVDQLARAVAKIAAAQHPHPVVVRMSDFKTNEYANLIGGEYFEPQEHNPMLGFRGAARYYSGDYREGFALECKAIKRAREVLGFENIIVMIPFCRTLEEADRVLEVMAENGLKRGENGLQAYVMAELPSNIVLAREFAERFDGFSIGSNDLTQLTLGVDRDSEKLAHLFDETNDAVKGLIAQLIKTAHDAGATVGICGQAPSDHPAFAAWLVDHGIDTISVNPDSVVQVIDAIAESKRR